MKLVAWNQIGQISLQLRKPFSNFSAVVVKLVARVDVAHAVATTCCAQMSALVLVALVILSVQTLAKNLVSCPPQMKMMTQMLVASKPD